MKLSSILSALSLLPFAIVMASPSKDSPSLSEFQGAKTKHGITVQESLFNCYNNNARCVVADQQALHHHKIKMSPLDGHKVLCNRLVPTPAHLSKARQEIYKTAPYECTSNTDSRILVECPGDDKSFVVVEWFDYFIGFNAYGKARGRFDASKEWSTGDSASSSTGQVVPKNFVFVDCKP